MKIKVFTRGVNLSHAGGALGPVGYSIAWGRGIVPRWVYDHWSDLLICSDQ